MKERINHHFSPEFITELSRCEIFVFGSNLEGQHMGGAARIAYEKFGAEWGVGDGPTGQCYAIPTMHGGLEDIRPYAKKFIEYAKAHPMNRFLLTRVGCGIAGFRDEDMAQLFLEARDIPNIAIPRKWFPSMCLDFFMDIDSPRGKDEAPKVITEEILKELCHQYAYDIGAGIRDYVPDVQIRYVRDTNDFGYVSLADCFFSNRDELYVWEKDVKWEPYHNQDIVNEIFGDECLGRGYAHKVIFAGVDTKVKDSNDENIFTGDVIQIEEDYFKEKLALGAFPYAYCFILDNHCLFLRNCHKKNLTRIGTVFFQLGADEGPVTIKKRTMSFNLDDNWDGAQERQELKLLMSRYTPNFETEAWKYQGLDVLGVEYKWNK